MSSKVYLLPALLALALTAGPRLQAEAQHHEHHAEEHQHQHHAEEHQHHAEEHQHQHHAEEHQHHEAGAYRHHETHHDFSDAERWTKVFDDPARDAWQKPAHVIALMKVEPGMTVADIGAGTGYFSGPLGKAVGASGHVLALDVEESLVDFIAERAAREGWDNVEARRVPFDDPQLDAGGVDRVLIVNTWHHIADRETYSSRLAAGLVPGGQVMIVDFTRDSPSGPPVEERLDPEQVIAELEAGGLEAELLAEDLPRQYVVVGRQPQAAGGGGGGAP